MFHFSRSDFFPIKKKISSNEITHITNIGILNKRILNNFDIVDISSVDILRNQSILFLNSATHELSKKSDFSKILVITSKLEIFDDLNYSNILLVSNLNESYNFLLNNLYYHEDKQDFRDEFELINNSYISIYSSIDSSVKIGNGCVIGRGVKISKNCILKNNVTIKNSIIEKDVIIGDGSVIGSTGFGFDISNMGSKNMSPQIGIVYISQNVRIGSNCTIDRGKIDYTIIGENCMLDNLIHVAHNVSLGKNVCIAAQTGISGSVKIGNNVIIGGQSGIAGHLTIGNNVIIAAKSGVTKNINDNSKVAGFPAIDIKKWKLNIIKNYKDNGYK